MVPPVGDGTGPMSGHTKHSRKMKATIPAGTMTPSEPRQRPGDPGGRGLVGRGRDARDYEITR